ncbi:MAG TPA: sigma 54-interacting transcriptional regulator [Geobacteraceae bacterium]
MNKTEQFRHCATILDSINEGVFTVDRNMVITAFNRAASKITGYSREEAIGRQCSEVMRANICGTICPIREVLETGESTNDLEVEVQRKDGGKIPISVNATVLCDEKGEIVGAVETFRDLSMIVELKKEIQGRYSFHGLISRNTAMQGVFETLPDVAASDATVLIHGESGTGKELVAQAIHNLSSRSAGPMVIVNCGALPEHLLEAEIFGAKRGAYTGSVENRFGRLDMAQGGTLFLDEIGDLPLPLQVKLLRVLEYREYQPLGSPHLKKADVRFITATHRNLAEMVESGTFRRDLFYRIDVVAVEIPPLRERREDIPLLLDHALAQANRKYSKKVRGFSPKALQILLNHPYPGNVRELINLVEQTVIMCRTGEITEQYLPHAFLSVSRKDEVAMRFKKCPSREILAEILSRHHGNRTKVAEELGVERTTLWRWMNRAGLMEH